MGVSYMAGVSVKIWKNVDEIQNYRKIDRTFKPQMNLFYDIRQKMTTWLKAIERFGDWY